MSDPPIYLEVFACTLVISLMLVLVIITALTVAATAESISNIVRKHCSSKQENNNE